MCVCMHVLPVTGELLSLSWGSLLPAARAEAADEEPRGLTMVPFMKQLGTGWEEDVREFRDLPDHVHCSQNSLQRSGGLERARVCQDGIPHLYHVPYSTVSVGARA